MAMNTTSLEYIYDDVCMIMMCLCGRLVLLISTQPDRSSSRIIFLLVQAPDPWTQCTVVAPILLLILLIILPLRVTIKPNSLAFILQIINVLRIYYQNNKNGKIIQLIKSHDPI